MTDTANPIDTHPPALNTPPDDEAPTRRCGRCILRFPIPTDAHPMELLDWWNLPELQRSTPTRTTPNSDTPQAEQHRAPT